MFSFLRSKNPTALFFHIGTSSVAAGVVEASSSLPIRVIFSARESYPHRAELDPERLIADMTDALQKANVRLVKYLSVSRFEAPNKAFYLFSSPWAMTEAHSASLQGKAFSSFDPRKIGSIIDASLKKQGASQKGMRLIAAEATDVKKTDTSIEIPFIASFVPEALYRKVIDIASTAVDERHLKHSSFSLASFSAIRDVFHGETDFAFVDMGAELSDVVIIKKGRVESTASVPAGGRLLARAIAAHMGVSIHHAESTAALFEKGHAEIALHKEIEPLIASSSRTWLDMAGISALHSLKIFAVAHDACGRLLLSASSTTDRKIEFIKHDDLRHAVTFDAAVERDPSVALIARFIGRVYESESR